MNYNNIIVKIANKLLFPTEYIIIIVTNKHSVNLNICIMVIVGTLYIL